MIFLNGNKTFGIVKLLLCIWVICSMLVFADAEGRVVCQRVTEEPPAEPAS